MSEQILIKRGNTGTISTYVGPLGELVLNTDTGDVYVQNGVTPVTAPLNGTALTQISANIAILQTSLASIASLSTSTGVIDAAFGDELAQLRPSSDFTSAGNSAAITLF